MPTLSTRRRRRPAEVRRTGWPDHPFVLTASSYLYLVHQKEKGSPTDFLLTDRPLLLDVALWPRPLSHRLHARRRCPAAVSDRRTMTFQIKAEGVDVDDHARDPRRIEESPEGLLTDAEVRRDRRPRLKACSTPRLQARTALGVPSIRTLNFSFIPPRRTQHRAPRGGAGGVGAPGRCRSSSEPTR